MIDVKNKCRDCDRCAVCKYSKDYHDFCDRLSNRVELDGDIVPEGVAHVEIKCKYFKSISNTVIRK